MSNKGNGLAEVLANHQQDSSPIGLRSKRPGRPGCGIDQGAGDPRTVEGVSDVLNAAVTEGQASNLQTAAWKNVRELLANLSRTRGLQGYSPSETASFVFSLKKPLFSRLRGQLSKDGEALAA